MNAYWEEQYFDTQVVYNIDVLQYRWFCLTKELAHITRIIVGFVIFKPVAFKLFLNVS